MLPSVYTPCCFIELVSFFMPLMSLSLSKPSVSWMIGSRRRRSSVASCSSSLAAAVIFSPFLVVMVSAEILNLVVGCSLLPVVPSPASAEARACFCSCADAEVVVGDSKLRFVGDPSGRDGIGSACRLRCVLGDVASGRSVIVFLRFGSSVSCCSVACLPVGGVSTVCVSSVNCGLVAAELAFGSAIGNKTAGAVATGVQGYALIESKSCLSKLSGCTSLWIVRALTTRVAFPRMCSPVAASPPSHTPLKNLCSSFGIVL